MQVTTTDDAMRMRQALAALCDDVGDYLNSESLLPLAGSRASQEMADVSLANQLVDAHHVGNLMLEAAADHAYALTLLLVEPVPTVAPFTCARGGLEASALSCWLLADDVSARERVSRSFACRYDGLREQEKLARTTGDEDSLRRISLRMDEVECKAMALGFPRVSNRRGERIGIGQAMPAKTKCIDDVFGQEALYRIFSAMAHSQSSALIQLGFMPFDAARPTLLKKGMNSDVAAVLLTSAADSLTKPTWAKARLFGLRLKRLAAILDRRYQELGLNETQRFWKLDRPS